MSDVKWINQIRAVGFDVDGTMYHSTVEMGQEVGKQVIEQAARELAKDPDEIVEEYLERREKYRGNTLTLNSFGLDGEKIFQDVWDQFPIEKFVRKDSKLVSLITKLKKRYRLFLISNGTGRQVERKLGVLGLNYHDFDPRIYCYDQGWVKPDPQPFLAAIESLNMKPEEIVYVGDREDVDVEGAQTVGMKTIFVGGPSASSGRIASRKKVTQRRIVASH
ncbi:MAG: HAD family hydrolase [bacterium]